MKPAGILRASAVIVMSGVIICTRGDLHADPAFLLPEEEFDLGALLDDISGSYDPRSDSDELSAIPLLGGSAAAVFSQSDSLDTRSGTMGSEEFSNPQPFEELVREQLPVPGMFRSPGPFQFTFRGGLRYQPDGGIDESRYYGRMRVAAGSGLTGMFLLERDPGELRALDLVSGSMTYSTGGLRITAGDYRPGFGQGLLFSRYGRSYVSGVATLQRDSVSLANTSFEESGYLRGVHAELRRGAWFAQGWLSSRTKDATLDADGHAVTIRETGLHPDGNNRDNLRERLGGARFGLTPVEGMEFAIAGVISEYTPALARNSAEYDLHDPEGSSFNHLSISGRYERGIVQLFGEAAALSREQEAIIGGIALDSRPVKASVLARRYDAGYWAPHSGSFSSFNGEGNEEGVYLALDAGLPGGISAMASMDAARTLNRTYLAGMPVSRRRLQFAADKRFSGGMTARAVFRSSNSDSEGYGDRSVTSIRLEKRPRRSGTGWRVLLAHSAGEGDNGGYLEGGLLFRGELVECEFGAGIFDIPSYAARYYRYERDVPGHGMSRAVWGRGGALLAVMRVREFSLRTVWRDSDAMALSREVAVQYDAVFHGR